VDASETGRRSGAENGAAGFNVFRAGDRPRVRSGTSDVELAIFAAVERLIETTPFSELAVADIISEADSSRASFYRYFSSKWAVVAALVERVMEEMFEQVNPFISQGGDESPREILRGSIVSGARLWASHRLLFRVVHEHWNSVPQLRDIWLRVNTTFIDQFAAAIERERQAGIAPQGVDSRQLAAILVWSSGQLMFVAGLGVEPSLRGEDALIETIADLWLLAVYGDPR
jgi:AcrR family transcriptional regulator